MKVLQENQNPLFNRKEVLVELESQTTPSHKEVEELISKQFNSNPEAFKIKKISGNFGSKTFTISANVYPSKEEKLSTEFKSKKEKEAELKAIEEAKKAEEEAKTAEAEKIKAEEEAKASAEEKPAEEVTKEETPKEETKPEEKPAEEKKE